MNEDKTQNRLGEILTVPTSMVSFWDSAVSILENIDCIISTLHWISYTVCPDHSNHAAAPLMDTVYPKKYAHGFVVLCFVVVMQSFIMNSHEVFIHIHQGCFAGTGAIVRLPQCQWSKPDGYGKISQCITTTKHSKAKTVCIFLGIYCSSCPHNLSGMVIGPKGSTVNLIFRYQLFTFLNTEILMYYSWFYAYFKYHLTAFSNVLLPKMF